jgi:enamine deaminase RidA (YjgF/YER057c/UK114 family)
MRRRRFCQLAAPAAVLASTSSTGRPAQTPPLIQPLSPTGHSYAQACLVTRAARWLFISGQVPESANGDVPDDYVDQYRLAWRNVEAQLRAAQMTFDNLVKVTIFLSDRSLIARSAGLRQEILGERSPALTIVITGIYDSKWLLEIEAIAAA